MAFLINPTDTAKGETTDVQAAARSLGVELHVLNASTERDFDAVFASLAHLRPGGLVIGSSALFVAWQEQLAALAVRHAMPAVFENREFVAAGGLMSYGAASPMHTVWPASIPGGFSKAISLAICRCSGRPSRTVHQPQDRQGARHRGAADAARPRRRGDRVRATGIGEVVMKLPRRNFCIWPRALPRCRHCHGSPGRKPIRRGRCASSSDFTAGGNIDIVARLIGQWLSERLGQPFIIENRPGAGAISPPRRSCARPRTAIRSLIRHLNAINATLYEKLNFNFIRDIAPSRACRAPPA